MFRGHWLVADLDGTLTPTPSKAGGRYYSLAQSARAFGASYVSCLPALRSFIAQGGSLCVVSTAGRRLWAQVYADLAPALYPPSTRTSDSIRSDDCNDDHVSSSPTTTSTTTTTPLPGRLLLCGFTGGALFRSRAPACVWHDIMLAHDKAASSNNSSSSNSNDDNAAVPPAAVALEEWSEYRQCAASLTRTSSNNSSNDNSSAVVATATTTMSDDARRAAAEESRAALIRFLEHASCVSGHDVARAERFFRRCLSAKYHNTFRDLLAAVLHDVRPPHAPQHQREHEEHEAATETATVDDVTPLCFAHAASLSLTALTIRGRYLRETNEALVNCQGVPHADGSPADDAPTAQVVIMGIPSAYYARVFDDDNSNNEPDEAAAATTTHDTDADTPPRNGARGVDALRCCAACARRGRGAAARLRACGLTLKPQPNSVCVHRSGVDKGTCVRWLCAHAARPPHRFALQRALALGDVPVSVDRPLAQSPPMTFVSLCRDDDDGLASGKKDGNSDDNNDDAAVRSNIVHVGGEEEGTALFLHELLQDCTRDNRSNDNDTTATTATTLFTRERVEACAARARARLRELQHARAMSTL